MITEFIYTHRYGIWPKIKKEINRRVSTTVSKIMAVPVDYKYQRRPIVYNNKSQIISTNNIIIDTFA